MNINPFSHTSVTFSTTLTKAEYTFMNYLIESEVKKIRKYHKVTNLLKILHLEKDKFYKLLEKVQRKSVKFEHGRLIGSMNLISSYEVEDEYIKIVLGEELRNRLLDKKDPLDLKTIFSLKENASLKFYYKCCYGVATVKELDYSIEELKELFLTNSYERFYDFERFVLKKIFKDLSENSPYVVNYEKLKKGESKNNKIIGIKILITNKFYHSVSSKIMELLSKYSNYNNYESAFSTLYELLKTEKIEKVEEALGNIKNRGSIEDEIVEEVESLKKDEENYSLVKVIEEEFSNLLKLQSALFAEVKKIESVAILYDEFVTSSFLKKLYKIGDGEVFTFQSENVKMIIAYNKKGRSKIEIYKKIIEETEL